MRNQRPPWASFTGALIWAVVPAVPTALAQDAPANPPEEINPLALKEEMIRDRFERFQDRLYRLRGELESVEPENARRLERALERAGELGLSSQLEEIIKMFRSSAALTDAADAQRKWLEDADRLLGLLLERDSDNEERRRELERLEAYRKDVSRLIEEEQALRDQSAQASVARRLDQQLDQALQRVDSMLERQADVSAKTGKAAESNHGAQMGELSREQADLAREAQQLAEDLERLSNSEPESSADSEAQQAARSEAGEASSAAKEGAKSMSQAGQAMQQQSGKSAQEEQASAEEALRRARDRLQRAKEELAKRSESAASAAEQRKVAEDTKGLADRMRSQEDGDPQSPSPPGGRKGSETPGLGNLDQAQSDMQDAAESLESGEPEKATETQSHAVEELEQALRELEDVLTQLRREDREETLRDLESRFREMLSSQRGINAATVSLAEIGREQFQRAQQLELADLTTQQRSLADRAGTCVHILDEEGTTIVFPRVVGQVSEDMVAVAERLAAAEVGPLTQTIEQDIVDTLEQLLEAVKRMQQENEQQAGGQQSGSDENQPLLPTSAELKLLRSSQVRVNNRTATIELARAQDAEPAELLAKGLNDAAERQLECAETAREMRDRQEQR